MRLWLLVVVAVAGLVAEEPVWQLIAPERALQRETVPTWQPDPAWQAAQARGTRSASGEPGSDYWQHEIDYELRLRIADDGRSLQGEGRIRFRNASPGPLAALHFEMPWNVHQAGAPRSRWDIDDQPGMQVTSVRIDQAELIDRAWQSDDTLASLQLPVPLASAALLELELRWEASIGEDMCSSRAGREPHLMALPYWYPAVRLHDDVLGWHLAPFQGNGEFTRPLADFQVEVFAPAGWLVQATGRLDNLDAHIDSSVVKKLQALDAQPRQILADGAWDELWLPEAAKEPWRFHAPMMRDHSVMLLRDLTWQAARHGNVLVQSFYPEGQIGWADSIETMQQSLDFIGDYFGLPYTWPHCTAIASPLMTHGGMEYPMLTILNGNLGAQRVRSVLAHELTHMWVPMRIHSDERLQGWVDEGLASHVDAHFDGDWSLRDNHQEYTGIASGGWDPVVAKAPEAYGGTFDYQIAAYVKTPFALEVLREEIGDERFRAGMHRFAQAWADKSPRGADLLACLQQAAGRDLGWFYQQWLHDTGKVDHAVFAVRERAGAWQVVIRDVGDHIARCPVRIVTSDQQTITGSIPSTYWLQGHRFAILQLPEGVVPAGVQLLRYPGVADAVPENDRWRRPLAVEAADLAPGKNAGKSIDQAGKVSDPIADTDQLLRNMP